MDEERRPDGLDRVRRQWEHLRIARERAENERRQHGDREQHADRAQRGEELGADAAQAFAHDISPDARRAGCGHRR